MTARDEIFASIRRSLHVSGTEAPRRAAVAARLSSHPMGVIPARGQGDAAKRLETFEAEALRAAATVARVDAPADVPAEIARYLREGNMPATLRIGDDSRLAAMPWGETTLEIAHGPSDGHDMNGLSAAFAAVAETGTLAMTSGVDNPTTINFLPDNHIVVVEARDVVGDLESVFARLRTKFGAGFAPRTLNFITGPSRSADIEQTLLFGAHGPRRLHIVLVSGAEA
jgi:L-lactate dehydrogenase complex protein LldG